MYWLKQLKHKNLTLSCVYFRLNLGLTRIGRGQHNDYYLDSAVLKNFISRSHVEIFGKQNENGEIEFILTDKGLNGTFINDIRVRKVFKFYHHLSLPSFLNVLPKCCLLFTVCMKCASLL